MHVSTYIFPARVTDRLVAQRLRVRTKIELAFVSVQTVFIGDIVRDDLADDYLICMSCTEVADMPSTFDQSDENALVHWTRNATFHVGNDAPAALE